MVEGSRAAAFMTYHASLLFNFPILRHGLGGGTFLGNILKIGNILKK